MVFTIEVKGMERLRSSFNNYAVKIPKFARRGTWLFANHLAARLRESAPRGATGFMKSKKGTHVKGTKKSNEWQIVMPFYTRYLESGTRPHWIPRMSKTANWARKHGMTFYYFKNLVAAKGTVGHPFTQRVVLESLKGLDSMLKRNIRRGIKLSKR